MMPSNLTPIPELYVSYESSQKLKVEAGNLVSLDLTPRQICDLELLMNGGFNPLKGFLSEELMPDTTHPSEKGHEIWANAIMPSLLEMMGK